MTTNPHTRRTKTALNTVVVTLCALMLTWSFSNNAIAAPKSELWEKWTTHNATATTSIDHTDWQRFLDRYVTIDPQGINLFAYGTVIAKDQQHLKAYISHLSMVAISNYTRAEQYAYWVNLYNALTINVVLDNFPVESIRDISSGFFSKGPWDLKLITIEGDAVSLNDIEHRILRPIWQDARTHYAVNCASLGCPNLQSRAFTAANTNQLLDESARTFINHPRAVTVTERGLILSSIYKWFKKDFGENLIHHLMQFADADLTVALANNPKIRKYRYDWQLNIAR